MEAPREEGKDGAREGEPSEGLPGPSRCKNSSCDFEGFAKNRKTGLEDWGETPIGEKERRAPVSSLSQRQVAI